MISYGIHIILFFIFLFLPMVPLNFYTFCDLPPCIKPMMLSLISHTFLLTPVCPPQVRFIFGTIKNIHKKQKNPVAFTLP